MAQIFVWVQYMTIFLIGLVRNKPRATPVTTRQKMFMTAIGICHVSGFLMVTLALEKIGVALYQIIYSSGRFPNDTGPKIAKNLSSPWL